MAKRKDVTQTRFQATAYVLTGMSKAALADLVIDLLRTGHGESLEGRRLAEAVVEAARPVLTARGDAVPRPDGWWDALSLDFQTANATRIAALRAEWESA